MEDLGTPQIFFLSSDKTRLTTKKFTVVLRLSLIVIVIVIVIVLVLDLLPLPVQSGLRWEKTRNENDNDNEHEISGETDESPSTDQKGAVPFPGRTSRTSAGFPRPVRSQLRHTVVRGRISLCR
jgi:hypothetical protein